MVDARKTLHKNICNVPAEKGVRFLKSRIPYASVVEQMGVHRAPVSAFAARTPIDYAYRALWGEIQSELDAPAHERGLVPEGVEQTVAAMHARRI